MLAKLWKKLLLAICIIATLFNITSKLVRRYSLDEQLNSVVGGQSLSEILNKENNSKEEKTTEEKVNDEKNTTKKNTVKNESKKNSLKDKILKNKKDEEDDDELDEEEFDEEDEIYVEEDDE